MKFLGSKILLLLFFCLLIIFEKAFSYNYKIYLNEEGIYKVNLLKYYDKKEIDEQRINLSYKGKKIPFYLSKSYDIIFYMDKKENKYSKYDVYLLESNKSGTRKSLEEIHNLLKKTIRPTLRLEKNLIYDPLPEYYRNYYLKFKKFPEYSKDHWFWKKIYPNEDFLVKFNTQNLVPETFRLKIFLQSRKFKDAPSLCRVSLNGEELGKENIEGEKILNFKIYKRQLKKGENVLKIENISKKRRRFFYLDWIKLESPNPRQPIITSKKLRFKSPSYIVLDKISSLKSTNNQADYLIITLSKFKKAILPLATFRQNQGYKVKEVLVEDIYDEFNFGNFSPIAIKEFIRYTQDVWQIKPYYILLVGDATADVNRVSPKQVIPTYTFPTVLGGETASDNYFVCLDDDSIPDLAIGRLPVQNEKELKLIINKIINYETSPPLGLWKTNFCLVAGDDPSYAEIFPIMEKAYMKMIKMYLPYEYYTYGLIGMKGSIYNYISDKYPEAIVERINKGCLVWNYIGHGLNYGFGPIYRGDKTYPLFNMEHLPRLKTNNRPPLILSICCLTGAFDYPGKDCLAEKWLKTKDGAIAVFASTRISDPYGNALLQKELVYHLFKEKAPTLGEALIRVKRGLIEREDYFRKTIDSLAEMAFKKIEDLNLELPPDLISEYLSLSRDYHLHMYNLLGDPALRLAYPKEKIKITLNQKRFKPGDKIKIKLKIENISSGKLLVRLESDRDKTIYPLKPVNYKDKNGKEIILVNYENANNKVVEEKVVDLGGIFLNLEFIIPLDLPKGRYNIRVYAHNNTTDAVGSYKIWVKDK